MEQPAWSPYVFREVPRNRPVMLKGPYTPPDGVRVRWTQTARGFAPHAATGGALRQITANQEPGFWVTDEGYLAAFEWTHWRPAS